MTEEITRKPVLLTALSNMCIRFPRVAILSGKVGILGSGVWVRPRRLQRGWYLLDN